MITQPPTYVKAIVAGLLAGLSALAAALGGEPSVTAVEWITVAAAALVTFGSVYGIPNAGSAKPLSATLTGPNQPTTFTNGGTGSNVHMVAREDVKQQFDRGGFPEPGTRLVRNEGGTAERIERPKAGGYPGGDVTPPD